ncbi:junctional adhesion molecule B isoform X2 [Microcaecilia unicolor]|uniref:Junctional adhesion molecule B isoform X2 n=1 Tax=Microcaecilia unicolor TaxID=1415580 RepID=A0A6P7XXH9_9AMPH|nr:junctional adhesion molecule B isoform X2 [Microcaecilia unicolor]
MQLVLSSSWRMPLLLLGCALALCYKACGVTIRTDNANVKVIEFEEAVLSCKYTIEKDPNPRLEWKKLGQNDVSFVYYKGHLVGALKTRAEMIDSSIRIKNVSRGDSGKYRCEVTAPMDIQVLAEVLIHLTVLVAPAVPVCVVPSSAMTGTVVELKCREEEGSPASQYRWFKDGALLLETSTTHAKVRNSSYTINKKSGTLQFNTVAKADTGEYHCEAYNGIGRSQKCAAKRMQVDDLNVSGIVSAVVVVALVVALCGLGVFYAQRKGYFSRQSSQKARSAYKSAPPKESDFKHTKSFVI